MMAGRWCGLLPCGEAADVQRGCRQVKRAREPPCQLSRPHTSSPKNHPQGPVCGRLVRPGGGVPGEGQGGAGRRVYRAPALRPHAPGGQGAAEAQWWAAGPLLQALLVCNTPVFTGQSCLPTNEQRCHPLTPPCSMCARSCCGRTCASLRIEVRTCLTCSRVWR